MLLLADENFPLPVIRNFRALGHDVLWARTDCTGWKDLPILERAEQESRLVLTLDKDLWQIALQRRTQLEQSGVILFRIHPAVPETLEPLVIPVLAMERDWLGYVSIVTAEGIQMWPAGGRQ